MDLQFTLDFLQDLADNNHKDWMDDNKKRYLEAKQYVIELVTQVVEKASAFDPSLSTIEPKKALFRINRDIRFSKNKDPYKVNFGAAIVGGGRNSGNPGYYLHLQPANNFIGGGLYQPPSEVLAKVRQEIDYNGQKLRSIISDKDFVKIYHEPYSTDRLKTAPKGYPKDHPDLDLLQLKHYVYMHEVSDAEVVSDRFVDEVVEAYRTLHPFNLYLREALD